MSFLARRLSSKPIINRETIFECLTNSRQIRTWCVLIIQMNKILFEWFTFHVQDLCVVLKLLYVEWIGFHHIKKAGFHSKEFLNWFDWWSESFIEVENVLYFWLRLQLDLFRSELEFGRSNGIHEINRLFYVSWWFFVNGFFEFHYFT